MFFSILLCVLEITLFCASISQSALLKIIFSNSCFETYLGADMQISPFSFILKFTFRFALLFSVYSMVCPLYENVGIAWPSLGLSIIIIQNECQIFMDDIGRMEVVMVDMELRLIELIYYARDNGWVEGKAENKFKPENVIKRSEMVVILKRMFA